MGVIDHMSSSEEGLQFIRDAEGKGLPGKPWVAYYCSAGVPTIGYGHTKGVTEADVANGRTCTEQQAEEWLRKDVVAWELAVERNVKIPLTQSQYDALISFTHNCGEGALRKIVYYLHKLGPDAVPARLMLYIKHKKPGTNKLVRNQGLVNRRTREVALWNRAEEVDAPAAFPTPQEVYPDTGKPMDVVKRSRTFWAAIAALFGVICDWLMSFFTAAGEAVTHVQEKATFWNSLLGIASVNTQYIIWLVIIGGALSIIYVRMTAEIDKKVG